MTIVVAGEALIDVVVGPDGALAAHPGGGPFNVARTVGRLGGPVSYLGRLSTDRFGRVLRGALEGDGVRLDLAVVTDDPTTLALAEIDAAGGASYRFYVDGTSAPGCATPMSATRRSSASARWGWSWSRGDGAGGRGHARLRHYARTAGSELPPGGARRP